MYAIGLNEQKQSLYYFVNVNTCKPLTEPARPVSKVVLFQVKVSFSVASVASVMTNSKPSLRVIDVALSPVNCHVPLAGQMGKPLVAV